MKIKAHTAAMFKRIQVRAYYIWLNEYTRHEKHVDGADVKAWLAAEAIEVRLAKSKAAKAKATKAANKAKPSPLVEMCIASTNLRDKNRPVSH